MILRIAGLLGLTGAVIAGGLFFYFSGLSASVAGQGYRWQAVAAEVAAAPVLLAVDPSMKADVAKDDRKVLYYRNPMGLPDTSPIPKTDTMGMDYIPVYAEEISTPPGTIR